MTKKFWIIMLVICFIIIGAANAFQTLSITQFKVGYIESGNNENYQTAFDNYNKNSNKKDAYTYAELSNKKFESHIILDPIVGTKGDKVQINASLINNQSGNGIPRQEIKFYGPDGNIIGVAETNDNGKATYDYIITQTPDKYSLKASYNGSCLYNPTDSITTLDINRWNLTIKVDDINCKYGDTIPVKVTIINSTNKAPIVGKMVNLRHSNGTFINQGITNSNGQFIYNYTVCNCPGENLMEATVNKDPEYNYKVLYFELNVNKSDVNLLANNVVCTRGNVCILKANLSTQTNKPLSNETITFYNNGTKIGENRTDNNGQASYSYICDVIGGNYPITTQYSGNDYYNSISSILQLHVYNW
ncbi:MAG: Ig-like domain-containing protein, partial [Methanobacterium sp.]|uniref:MSCRAMM family protein n=1 Tax=Methanobacterium sp. TaxID=2164 RepID=UPI003C75E487